MSQWEYEAGRKICLRNMANGDFSNWIATPVSSAKAKELIAYAEQALKDEYGEEL